MSTDYPIARPFSWYALVYDDKGGGAYGGNVLPLGTCTDLQEFCQYLNHVPLPGQVFDGAHAWRFADGQFGYGMCFFDAAVRPEWEDAANASGIDLVHRAAIEPSALTEAWRSVLLLFVNGQLEDATGARCTMKVDRRGQPVHKLEVWTRRAESGEAVAAALRRSVGLEFTCVPRRLGGKK